MLAALHTLSEAKARDIGRAGTGDCPFALKKNFLKNYLKKELSFLCDPGLYEKPKH